MNEFFHGHAIRDTGRRDKLYGATWRVCEYLEGPNTGAELYRPLEHPDPEYADVDETGQLSIGVAGEQRAIPGLAQPRREEQ